MQDGIRTLTELDLMATLPTQTTQIGAVGATEDGRFFRYVKNGATQLAAGVLAVAPAVAANSTGLAIPAQAASNLASGSTTLIVTNGATVVTQDQFAEGFVEVLGAGGPYAVRIRGNSAAAASGAITLLLSEPITSALVAGTNTVNLTASPYSGIIVSTTASEQVGVTRNIIPANNYGWVQTYGHCVVPATGAIVKGAAVSQDSTTAGNVVTDSGVLYQVGLAKEAAAGGFVTIKINV